MSKIDDNREALFEDVQRRWLMFYSMLVYVVSVGFMSVLAYLSDDTFALMVFFLVTVLVMVGLGVQLIMGIPYWLRLYYSSCFLAVFFVFILTGSEDSSSLLAALAVAPGFVLMVGWRYSLLLIPLLSVVVGVIFYTDTTLHGNPPFSFYSEVRFVVIFLGMGVFFIAWDYAVSSSQKEMMGYTRKVHEMAYRDPMTGLANRRAMEELLVKRWEEYRRTGQIYSLLLCDIDHLKALNDQYGHELGDMVLNRVANVLSRSLRAQDMIARWGDDEFLILLPGQTQNTGLKVAERLRKRVEAIELIMAGKQLSVSASVGVAGVEQVMDATDLLTVSNNALFQAKHMGRNQVVSG